MKKNWLLILANLLTCERYNRPKVSRRPMYPFLDINESFVLYPVTFFSFFSFCFLEKRCCLMVKLTHSSTGMESKQQGRPGDPMEPHMAKRMRKATIKQKSPMASDRAKPRMA